MINDLMLDLRSRSRKRSGRSSRSRGRRTSLGNSNMAIARHGGKGVWRSGRLGRGGGNRGREDNRELGGRGGNLLQDLGARTDPTAEVEVSGSLKADKLLLSKKDIAQTLADARGNVQRRGNVRVGEDFGRARLGLCQMRRVDSQTRSCR